jgi:hypothetical protein
VRYAGVSALSPGPDWNARRWPSAAHIAQLLVVPHVSSVAIAPSIDTSHGILLILPCPPQLPAASALDPAESPPNLVHVVSHALA